VLEVGCPLFVPAVERNELDSPQLRAAAADYLVPLLAARVEVIVLGCTHYPLLEPLLRSLLPAGVQLVDPALAAMAVLETLLMPSAKPVALSPDLSRCRLVVTGDAADFASGASHWLGQPAQVQQVNLRCPGGDL